MPEIPDAPPLTLEEELIRFVVTFAVYVCLNLASWRNLDQYHNQQPWRCGLTGFGMTAAGIVFGGYQMWVKQSVGAMVALPLAAFVGDFLAAKRKQREQANADSTSPTAGPDRVQK
jgi:hypothetical protein